MSYRATSRRIMDFRLNCSAFLRELTNITLIVNPLHHLQSYYYRYISSFYFIFFLRLSMEFKVDVLASVGKKTVVTVQLKYA